MSARGGCGTANRWGVWKGYPWGPKSESAAQRDWVGRRVRFVRALPAPKDPGYPCEPSANRVARVNGNRTTDVSEGARGVVTGLWGWGTHFEIRLDSGRRVVVYRAHVEREDGRSGVEGLRNPLEVVEGLIREAREAIGDDWSNEVDPGVRLADDKLFEALGVLERMKEER